MIYYLEAFKKYATFTGRARRKEYWMFLLFHMILVYGMMFLGTIVSPTYFILYLAYLLATMLPALAVGVRRMHDVGKSGWYLLIPIYSLILACTDSVDGPNEYGENPKGLGDGIDEIGTIEE